MKELVKMSAGPYKGWADIFYLRNIRIDRREDTK